MDLSIDFPLVMKPFYFCHGVASNKWKPSGFNKCLELIMAIFWRDLTAHRWHWFILIYFLWLEHVAYTRDLTAFCREQYNGVWSYSCVIPQIFTSWDWPDRGLTDNCFFLTDSPCTWFRRWVYRVWADCSAFDFSHAVDIPICGNRLWYAFMLPLKSNC